MAVRLVAALSSAVSAGLLYATVAPVSGRRPALLSGLVLAGAHFAVLYGRFGYTYNLLLLWSAATLACVVFWQRSGVARWQWLAMVTAALGLLTDQEGIFLPLFVTVLTWSRLRTSAATLAIAIAPAAAFALMMLVVAPAAARTDWGYSLLRVQSAGAGGPAGLGGAFARWFVNYLHLLRAEWWLPLGIAGLLCIRPLQARRTALLLAGLMVLPIFAVRELEPFFRTGIPLLLPLSWGAGALLDTGIVALSTTFGTPVSIPSARRFSPLRLGRAAATAFVVGLPLGLEIGRSAGALAAGFSTRFDWALVSEGAAQSDARTAADYVNRGVRSDDVVVVSPAVAWLYHSRVVDFFQATAWQGDPIAFYPAGIPRSRFQFDPSISAAEAVVVDPFWDRWASEVPVVHRALEALPLADPAARIGGVRVYDPSARRY